MQDNKLNGQNNTDVTKEELVDITSEDAGFIVPDNNLDEETDINEIRSDLKIGEQNKAGFQPNNIQLADDFKIYSENNSNQNNRYAHSEKKEGFFSKHKISLIISGAAVVVIAAVGVLLWQLSSNGIIPNPFEETVGPIVNDEGEFTYLTGVKISGLDISGKTYEEAKKLLEDNQSKFTESFTLTVDTIENSYEFTSDDFTYTYNIEEVLESAKSYSEDVYEKVNDATKPTTDEEGNYADLYTVTATVEEASVKAVAERIAEDTDVTATNARISKFTPYAKNRFEYQDGTTGYKTDREDLVEQIKSFIDEGKISGKIDAKVETIEPDITLEMVKKNIVALSYYTTTSVNTENATSNMGTALKACNGSVIEPGETWSFNECTGDSNLESNGYLPAGVISNGSMAQGVGGGLCQASSTIYNAALFANMEIVERYNHYWASVYVPAGLDATIDYPNLDLKLKNTTKYQMFIECALDDRKLSCTIYGYQDPSYDDIATFSENYDIVSGSSYNTSAYRVLYKDGKEVSREELPGSHYSLTAGHYVQYADSGTHRMKPDGTTTEKKPKDEPKETETASSKSSSKSSSSSSSSKASSSSQSSSSSKSSSSKASSASSSKPSSTSSSSKPSSSSSSSSKTPSAQPTTAPTTEAKPESENAVR